MNKAPKPGKHGRDHDLGGEDPTPHRSFRNIKVFADANAADGNLPDAVRIVSTGDGKFIWEIDLDEDGLAFGLEPLELVYVRAYVTTVSSSGSITVQLRNITKGHDMLSTPITIEAGDFSSRTAGTQPVINLANAEVDDGDQIAIDVDAAGTDAEGLGVNVGIGPG